MLGFEGIGVFAAYILCIIIALFCIVYGITTWNISDENELREMKEEAIWELKDDKIRSNS